MKGKEREGKGMNAREGNVWECTQCNEMKGMSMEGKGITVALQALATRRNHA
jgi:hypothetical protein